MLKRFFILSFKIWIIAFVIGTTHAQEQDLRSGNTLPVSFYISQDDSLSIEDLIISRPSFTPLSGSKLKSHPSNTYWLKVDFIDELARVQNDSIWYLRCNRFEYASVFLYKDHEWIEQEIGSFQNMNDQSSVLYKNGVPFEGSSLFEGRYLFIKAKRVTYFESLSRWNVSYGTEFQNTLIQEYYSSRDLGILIPVYTFAGICLVIFILTLAFFLYSQRLEFLFYTLYVLFLFFYLTSDIIKLHDLFFGGFSLYSYTFFQVAQVIINLFYILFVIYYLNSKKEYPKLHLALKVIVYTLSLIIILETYFLLSTSYLANIYILDIERIIMTVFGLMGMIYLLIKSKDKLGYFIVAGSFLYMVGALALLFFKVRAYMIIGSSLEILIFASGLTYKIQQEYKERLRFQRESLENENRALRAQMNPHFIFNSLNSIQNLITSNKKEAAVKYLNKFSLLIRSVLESSFETNVILSEEISLLHKYLELEALRFNNTFKYSISVDENLNPDLAEVPALLVQPFVENAILHGLLHEQLQDKWVHIHFKKEASFIICEIEDSGIGRDAAQKSKSLLHSTKRSRGIEVTQKRLQIFNHSLENDLEFIDKTNELGEATGTLVRIKISTE